jgi:hypothetical protein
MLVEQVSPGIRRAVIDTASSTARPLSASQETEVAHRSAARVVIRGSAKIAMQLLSPSATAETASAEPASAEAPAPAAATETIAAAKSAAAKRAIAAAEPSEAA